MFKSIITTTLLCILSLNSFAETAPWVGSNLKGSPCQGGGQGYGPYDYLKRNTLKNEINIVESAHFTPEVENLIRGNASGVNPEADIDYTLRAWPNHHRALLSIINFQLNINNKISPYKSLKTSPECYLQRAINFSRKDAFSYSLYGHYLRKIGLLQEAKKMYSRAILISPNNVRISYSYSLLLIDLKEYDESLKYAKVAYNDKATPISLKNKLIRIGVWKE
jgi:tetratricopeptide (TPR) repeat protein